MSSKKNKTFLQKAYRVLAGFELATVCLILLFILTFFGTIEQKWNGLHATVEKYFDLGAFFVIPSLENGKIIPLPLPGAYWVMVVLSINMFLGGLVKARKGWSKAGVLVSHFAILFMLIAGAVSSISKREGNMLVLQGHKSDFAQSYFDFDIEVFQYDEQGERMAPKIIPSEALEDLSAEDVLKVDFPDFPFDFEIEGYLPYSALGEASGSIAPDGQEVVDGFFLAKSEPNKEKAELDTPGAYLSVKGPNGELVQRLILYGGSPLSWNPSPVTFNVEGKKFGVTMLKKIWPMPFEIELHRSVGEYHPKTQIPSWFQSDITKVSDGQRADYEIVMNEPARHSGYVIYQANWFENPSGPASGFAIVKNPSDKWPEWATYASAIGLTFHFLVMLFRFSARGRRSKIKAQTES